MIFKVISSSGFYSLYGYLGLQISAAIAESGWGLDIVYIIFLFNFERSIVPPLITIYLHVQ
jgi:hypothetical protein